MDEIDQRSDFMRLFVETTTEQLTTLSPYHLEKIQKTLFKAYTQCKEKEYKAALKLLENLILLLKKLCKKTPELKHTLIGVQISHADVLTKLKSFSPALTRYNEVIIDLQLLIKAGHVTLKPIFLEAQMNQAICFESIGLVLKAQAAYKKIITNFELLLTQEKSVYLQHRLMSARAKYANTLSQLGELPKAVAIYQDVIRGWSLLTAPEHSVSELLIIQRNYAITLKDLGNFPEALRNYDKVIFALQQLVENGQVTLKDDLLKAKVYRAGTLHSLERLPEATLVYEEVIGELQGLVDKGRGDLKSDLLEAKHNYATTCRARGQLMTAKDILEGVARSYKVLIAKSRTDLWPTMLMIKLSLAGTLSELSLWLEALVAYQEVISEYQKLIAAKRTDLMLYQLLAQMGRASTLDHLRRFQESLTAHREVITGFKSLVVGRKELQHYLLLAQMNYMITLEVLLSEQTDNPALQTVKSAWDVANEIIVQLDGMRLDSDRSTLPPETLRLLSGCSGFLAKITTSFQQPTSSHISLFHQSVAILERASEQYTVLSDTQSAKFISQFWFVWLSYWLSHDQIEGIFDVLRHTHSRKLAQQALAALEAQATKHPGQQRYLDLLNELRQLEKSLQGPEAGNTAAAGDNNLRLLSSLPLSSVANRESTLKYYHHLQDEARILKAQLIRDGLLPDVHPLESLSLPELQQQLDRDNDVLLHWLFPTAYGIEGQPPCLLMISATETQLYRFPAQAANGNTWTADILQLFNSLHNGLCRDGRAVRDLYATSIAQDDPSAIRQSPAELHETICQRLHQHVWEPVQSWLDTLPSRPRRMHLITQDSSHLLPWQGTFPAALAETTTLHTHPGLFAYLKQHDTQTMTWPTPAHPLWVLADLQQADPLKRLYFLPLEVALLQEIWGNKAVYISHDMSEPPTAERLSGLCLLGHGSFGQFLLGEQKLNDHTLATLKPDFTILDTSACVLAQVQDQQHEPEGFLMGGLLNAQTRWMNGSLMPVDDLLATLRTGLWHYHWSQQANDVADPRTALALAFKQLQEGSWHLDAGFVARLESALRSTMPRIAAQLLADKHWLEQQLENEHELARYEQLKRRLDALLIQSGNLTMPLRRKVDLIWGELQSLASESDLVLKEERIKHWAVRAQACLQGSMTMEIACLTTYWVR